MSIKAKLGHSCACFQMGCVCVCAFEDPLSWWFEKDTKRTTTFGCVFIVIYSYVYVCLFVSLLSFFKYIFLFIIVAIIIIIIIWGRSLTRHTHTHMCRFFLILRKQSFSCP